jgi:hypothetical protein
MKIDWVRCTADEVRPGDRVAPLSTWTLTVLAIAANGDWIAVNHDNNQVSLHRGPHRYRNLYRLVVTP